MLKEFSIVFCTMLYLVKDIDMGPLPQISQWSGQINGYESNRTWGFPGFNYGNGDGGQGNGMNSGQGNGMNSGQGNGMSSGQGNGMSSGQGNGMNSGQGNGMNSGLGNGMNSMNGWQGNGMDGWQGNGMDLWQGNGMNGGPGNGGGPGNYSYSFGEMQSQANRYPGGGYPASYYQQYSNQTFVVPTPANYQDLQNTTAPNQNTYADQMYSNGGNMGNMANMGNINNPTGFQYQGCIPQSSVATMTPVTQENETVTQGSANEAETTASTNGSEDNKTSTTATASTRKRSKH